jgi:hypothetical protein
MKIVATNGSDKQIVRLKHWWPGRWMGGYDIVFVQEKLIRKAYQKGTKYMTVAQVDLGSNTTMVSWARCCPKDQPSRAAGRFIALLRLARALRPLGYRLEKVQ